MGVGRDVFVGTKERREQSSVRETVKETMTEHKYTDKSFQKKQNEDAATTGGRRNRISNSDNAQGELHEREINEKVEKKKKKSTSTISHHNEHEEVDPGRISQEQKKRDKV